MFDLFNSLTASDIIEIVSIICSSILSVVAIVISVLTLKQNNQMVFESNKPNIVIFAKMISFTTPYLCLILKNFGNSAATILSVESNESIINLADREPFKHIHNTFIAPNQSFVYPLDYKKDSINFIKFKITYNYLNKTYVEEQCVNLEHFNDICSTKSHSGDTTIEISNVLQESVIQQL